MVVVDVVVAVKVVVVVVVVPAVVWDREKMFDVYRPLPDLEIGPFETCTQKFGFL